MLDSIYFCKANHYRPSACGQHGLRKQVPLVWKWLSTHGRKIACFFHMVTCCPWWGGGECKVVPSTQIVRWSHIPVCDKYPATTLEILVIWPWTSWPGLLSCIPTTTSPQSAENFTLHHPYHYQGCYTRQQTGGVDSHWFPDALQFNNYLLSCS